MSCGSAFPASLHGYDVKETVGYGSTSEVARAVCVETGQQVAVKQIDLTALRSADVALMTRELGAITRLTHKNVVRMHTHFVENDHLVLITEYLSGGSLRDILTYKFPSGISDEESLSAVLYQALKGISFMHSNGKVHRDLKGSNILVSSKGLVKVSDFGVSASFMQDVRNKGDRRPTFMGAPYWMAPEVLESSGGCDAGADIWSLGMTAVELATGKVPNEDLLPLKAVVAIIERPPPTVAGSPAFQDFVHSCLRKNASKRASAAELMEHDFFSSINGPDHAKALVAKLLGVLPPLYERVKETNKQRFPAMRKYKDSGGDDDSTLLLLGGDGLSDVTAHPGGGAVDVGSAGGGGAGGGDVGGSSATSSSSVRDGCEEKRVGRFKVLAQGKHSTSPTASKPGGGSTRADASSISPPASERDVDGTGASELSSSSGSDSKKSSSGRSALLNSSDSDGLGSGFGKALYSAVAGAGGGESKSWRGPPLSSESHAGLRARSETLGGGEEIGRFRVVKKGFLDGRSSRESRTPVKSPSIDHLLEHSAVSFSVEQMQKILLSHQETQMEQMKALLAAHSERERMERAKEREAHHHNTSNTTMSVAGGDIIAEVVMLQKHVTNLINENKQLKMDVAKLKAQLKEERRRGK